MSQAIVPRNEHELEEFVRRVVFRGVSSEALTYTLLMCKRYDLDPVLKHVVVIKFGGKQQPYITRDGLLHVAHRSGQLDGMTAICSVDEDGDRYAEATVWRKDMGHPFVYRAYASEYNTDKNVWKSHPKAMLIKAAEVITLRRAFDVSMTALEEMDRVIEREGGAIVYEGEVVEPARPPQQQPQPAPESELDAQRRMTASR